MTQERAGEQVAAELARFEFEGRGVRVETENGEPWFCAADVCDVLAIGTEQTRRLRDDEKGLRQTQTPGGTQRLVWVTEPGLYKLILKSSKPEAERFADWVTHEVLPAIRKTGGYALARPETSEQLIARALVEAQRVLADRDRQLAEKTEQIADLAPAAKAWRDTAEAQNDVSLQAAGKALGLRPNKWIAWLKERGDIYDRGRNTLAAQRHLDAGRLIQRVVVVDGKEYVSTRVTPRGLVYFGERRPAHLLVNPLLEARP